MTFRVGQKVVVVDDSHATGFFSNGDVFTVLALQCEYDGSDERMVVDCRPCDFGTRSWSKQRFRPIVERKTDISVFHEILRTARLPANALALTSAERGGE